MDARALIATAAAGALAATVVFKAWPSLLGHTRSDGDEDDAPPAYPLRGARTAGAAVDTGGVLAAGHVAVITGAASGIGRATALALAARGMCLALADIDADDLAAVAAECTARGAADTLALKVDVSSQDEVERFCDAVYARYGEVAFLMNNAAIQNNGDAGPYEHAGRWRDTLAVNLWGVVHGVQAFTPRMLAQNTKAVIVNTGSKQGITCPPGDTAYNVSKAGVKVLTEALQHRLRAEPGARVSAFLLVPGWTITMICTRADKRLQGAAFDPAKAQDERSYDGVATPAAVAKLEARGAWRAEQTVDYMLAAVDAGRPFYIICPDNETPRELDDLRIQWASDDLVFRRVPLSRWSAQYKDEYKQVTQAASKTW